MYIFEDILDHTIAELVSCDTFYSLCRGVVDRLV